MKLLKVENLYKRYSEDFSLKKINFELEAGEVHCVIGENGCGKTCLMKNISGLDTFDKGNIYINDEKINYKKNDLLNTNKVLFIMQEPMLFNNLSIAENIFFESQTNLSYKTLVNYDEIYQKCTLALKELGINIDVHKKAGSLSLSEKQLVEIVRAYVTNCKIIIFDEPSTTFTDKETNILFGVIKYLKNRGYGIIYISHRLKEIREIADKISIFAKGEIVATENVSECSDEDILKKMATDVYSYTYPKVKVNTGKIIFEVKNLSSGSVLKDISFSLKQGEIVGVTGLVGSGRTYLSNYLYGAIHKNKIDRLFKEENVQFSNTKDAIKNRIIMLPENREEFAIFNGKDGIFNTSISALKRFSVKSVIEDNLVKKQTQSYFDKFNIFPKKVENKIETFSGGNKQKIILSKLLMTNSLIYILDEPTRGIDIPTKVDIYNCMNDIVSKGGTILFMSSDVDELLGMTDKILVLESGCIVKEFITKETTKEAIYRYALSDNSK
ncbi:MAG: sugar ABC transporter ATP-binding protein [Lachnospirales bacterium]